MPSDTRRTKLSASNLGSTKCLHVTMPFDEIVEGLQEMNNELKAIKEQQVKKDMKHAQENSQ